MKPTLLLAALFLVTSAAHGQDAISGHVLSLDTGEPIAGAVLTLKDARGLALPDLEPVSTDADGYYSFENLAPGTYTLYARASANLDEGQFEAVLVSSPFEAGTDPAQIHVGFSFAGFQASMELSAERQDAHVERRSERGPIEVSGVPSLALARVKLLRSTINAGGDELLTAAYPDGLRR